MKKLLIISMLLISSSSFGYIIKDAKNADGIQTMIATCQNFDNTPSGTVCMVKRKQLSQGQWGPWGIVGKKGAFTTYQSAIGECCSASAKK